MLTIITATLNAAALLNRALASVEPVRRNTAIQHLVVDGGSTDDTAKICGGYPDLTFVSVPGCSIYEAWNRGIEMVQGDSIVFLNADDELEADSMPRIKALLQGQEGAEIIAGNAELIDDDGLGGRRQTPIFEAAPSGNLEVQQLVLGVPAINAMIFRRSVFERFGRFDTRYAVAGDRAFLLRLALTRTPPKIVRTDTLFYRYHAHNGSLTLRRSLDQRLRIARDHIELAKSLLADEVSPTAVPWLKYMRRREAAVAALRCLAAAKPLEAYTFLVKLFYGSSIMPDAARKTILKN